MCQTSFSPQQAAIYDPQSTVREDHWERQWVELFQLTGLSRSEHGWQGREEHGIGAAEAYRRCDNGQDHIGATHILALSHGVNAHAQALSVES